MIMLIVNVEEYMSLPLSPLLAKYDQKQLRRPFFDVEDIRSATLKMWRYSQRKLANNIIMPIAGRDI